LSSSTAQPRLHSAAVPRCGGPSTPKGSRRERRARPHARRTMSSALWLRA
jgi:hypothetical protein